MTQNTSNLVYDDAFIDSNNNTLDFISEAKKVKRTGLMRNKDFSLASPTLNKRYRFSVLPTVIK